MSRVRTGWTIPNGRGELSGFDPEDLRTALVLRVEGQHQRPQKVALAADEIDVKRGLMGSQRQVVPGTCRLARGTTVSSHAMTRRLVGA